MENIILPLKLMNAFNADRLQAQWYSQYKAVYTLGLA